MKVASVGEMRSMDRYAIENLGISEEILMENAGHVSSLVLRNEIGIKGKRIAVVCGTGNNGGDGFVVARNIHANGGTALVFIVGDAERFQGAAKRNLDILRKFPLELRPVESVAAIRSDILHSHGIVDALFGTGLDREVGGVQAEVIQLINDSGKSILSLDIPSGVSGDTGEIMGSAVKADWTITYGLPKIGNLLYPGYGLCGKLFVTHITFPPALHSNPDISVETNDYIALPPREKTAHKGQMGDVLFVAGAANYFGAPYFSALSHLRGGGGYARLASPQSVIPVIAAKGSEIVFFPQMETDAGSIAPENRDRLFALSEKVDMVVLGPGLSLDDRTQQLVRELAASIGKPLLIDGDGITAVAQSVEIIKERKTGTVLTPHVGEMARITNRSAREIERNRISLLKEAARSWNALIVLKGPHSLIGTPDGRVFINLSGNPGMATAGSGDVLTGTITAMVGLGLSLEEAVRKGVFLHGTAGDLAAADKGEDGMTAQDVLDFLPYAVKQDREGLDARYEIPRIV